LPKNRRKGVFDLPALITLVVAGRKLMIKMLVKLA
jgi:hypothetical protein